MNQENTTKIKDPVCDMLVDPNLNRIRFHGIRLAFCSKQCKDRFQQNPGLYLGKPGTKSPRQEGIELAKKRSFRLANSNGDYKIESRLRELMGIKNIILDPKKITVEYDLLQVSAVQIEVNLNAIGIKLSNNLLDKIKRFWIHFQEQNILDSMEVDNDSGPSRGCH